MRNRLLGLVLVGIVALALLLVVLLRQPSELPTVPPESVVAAPTSNPMPPSRPVAARVAPAPTLADAGIVAAVAAPPAVADEWKAPWASIPLDAQGRTLGMQGQAAFRQTVVKAIKPELKNCIEMLPADKDVPEFSVELFVEATGEGYLIKRAEVPRDAGLDPYESRCFEAAFEKRIALESSSNRSGELFHLGFPLRISPPVQVDIDAGVGG